MYPIEPISRSDNSAWIARDKYFDNHGLGILNNMVNLFIKASLIVRPEPKPYTYGYYLKNHKNIEKCFFFMIPGRKLLYEKQLQNYFNKIIENKIVEVPEEYKKDLFEEYGDALLKNEIGKEYILASLIHKSKPPSEVELIQCFSEQNQLILKKELLLIITGGWLDPLPKLSVYFDEPDFDSKGHAFSQYYNFCFENEVIDKYGWIKHAKRYEAIPLYFDATRRYKSVVSTQLPPVRSPMNQLSVRYVQKIRKDWVDDVLKDSDFARTPLGIKLNDALKNLRPLVQTTI